MGDPFQELQDELDKLNQAYRERLPEKIRVLETTWAKVLQFPTQGEFLQEFHLKVHSLTGSGATYGLPVLSDASRKLELALKDLIITGMVDFDLKKDSIQALLKGLKEIATGPVQLAPGPDLPEAPSIPEETPLPAEASPTSPPDRPLKIKNYVDLNSQIVTKPVENRVIWLIEDDQAMSESLRHQLGYFGYEVTCFDRTSTISEIAFNQLPVAVIFDLTNSKEQLNDLGEKGQTQRFKMAGVPLVFISAFTDLDSRLEAVRVGGKAYLTKPIKTRELIDILDKLTSLQVPDPYQILIIDDDLTVANHYGVTLRRAGMKIRIVNHPKDVLKALAELGPDLILMDFHMPGCTGPELAAVIRQQQAYVSIPIVFLSAETDINQQLEAMGRGGDDFLTKPIMPSHLVSSITIRAQRSRILREFMVRDSLTGLLNHTETKARLNLEVARAKRNGEQVTFAMLDIDHFKRVNDTFGHLAGDGVIKSISRLLQQRLRKTDIIGRYGGEEFAVILPNTGTFNAEKVLNEIRESFSNIRHQGEKIEFAATFSCGIASFPQYQDPFQLNTAADQALYLAKDSGRNRLVVARPDTLPIEQD
ncbi:MAG: response regulator receiver modulated diguanylate cyclase [Chloroflexi bacterium]|jgi:diguanylate cyclase (GGDEF)-like protein|nr:response regulator receiver modulated diguanylate cyclase [Chloroflexota bacterium]